MSFFASIKSPFDWRKITYGFPGRRRLNHREPSRTSSLRAATPQHGSAYAARLQRMLQAAGKEPRMIVRIWHGRTWRTRADEYAVFLTKHAIPDYRGVAGNLDVNILRRDEGDVSHFLTVTRWESEEAIRAFAGSDVLKAKYYPEDKGFLLEFEARVQHFTVVAGTVVAREPAASSA
jgi:heme-degrading monooxygenase HmoA